jgi:hypothetical protein
MMHARQDMRLIGLDFHTPTAPVPLLPPPEFAVHKRLVHGQPGGKPGQKGNQSLAVRLPGCEVAQHAKQAL